MLKTLMIYAAFSRRQDAENAAAALMYAGVRAADVHVLSGIEDGANSDACLPGQDAAVPVSPADMPDDLPVPSFSGLGSAVTAAIDLNTGTRIGEDGSVMHPSPGYAYEGLEIEAQDARSGLFAAHSDAVKLPGLKAHLESGGTILKAGVTDGQDQFEIIALLEKYGASSVQAA